MTSWYISEGKKTDGPLSQDDVILKIKNGDVKASAIVWARGMKTWEPITAHFGDYLKNIAETPAAVETPVTSPADIPPAPGNATPLTTMGILTHLVSHAVVVGFLYLIFFILNKREDYSDITGNYWLALLLLGAGAVAIALIYRTWKYAAVKSMQNRYTISGILKLGCVFLGLFASVTTVIFLQHIPLAHQIDKARNSYNKYTVETDVATNTITARGLIGPHFAQKIQDSLELHAGIETIIIDSPGGLTDEALKAAKIIESHKSVRVVARNTCNSACLIILMAADDRYADWDLELGFHAASSITNINKEYLELAELGSDADAYLLRRGMPKKFMTYAFTEGPKDLHLVSAIDLYDEKVLDGLRDGESPISSDVAKWRVVENAIATVKSDIVAGFVKILQTVRDTSPALLEKYADRLYQGYAKNDEAALVLAIQNLIDELMTPAMNAADGKVLYEYMKTNAEQVGHLMNAEDWEACTNYLNGNAKDSINNMSHTDLNLEYEALEKVIRSAGTKKWAPQPIPQWASRRGEALAGQSVLALQELGLNPDHIETDKRTECVFTYTFLKLVIDQGEADAPILMRWLLSES